MKNAHSMQDAVLRELGRGLSCSQAIAAVYGPALGVDSRAACCLAAGFAGGIGGMGHICGALSSAFMVMGLYCGRTYSDPMAMRQMSYALAYELAERFAGQFGSINCRELCLKTVPPGQSVASALRANLEPVRMVRGAVGLMEGLLEEHLAAN